MTLTRPYLLDTTALINFSKGFEPSRSKILTMIDARHQLAICSVAVAEFFAGLAPADRQEPIISHSLKREPAGADWACRSTARRGGAARG